ncbi:hypothetical protein [Sphingobacterium sp. DR205]|uniref:hypothetical protein n=1 Tax=Sphingobacterium sp. DR205 TaxID=2713573 RepID=UPI0013E4BA93|nr:hypothetical protein [Sphingobacterium sp. DR205]QIH35896.1 hypothetical protein G6053_24815 [Sphingobacterium sp. DR205]
MIKQNLLKPLSRRIHIAFWMLYFSWLTAVNIYKFGWGHIYVMIGVTPIILWISYTNRNCLRSLLFRKIELITIIKAQLYFLLTSAVVYLTLYQCPTEISKKILKNPQIFRIVDFGIDILTFYFTFALKGAFILMIEILYNLTTGIIIHLGLVRLDSQGTLKSQIFRDWVSHFMGNLTQSFVRLIRKVPSSIIRVDALLKIESYAIRQLNFREDILVNLENEIKYLRLMMHLYDEKHIKLQLDIEEYTRPIIPMMLMSLYKNMVKHGDFGDLAQPAILSISTVEDKILINCRNKIAPVSAWIYNEGGTGLGQLRKLLRLEYKDRFSLVEELVDGMFYLNIEIQYSNGNDKEIIKAGEETQEDQSGHFG